MICTSCSTVPESTVILSSIPQRSPEEFLCITIDIADEPGEIAAVATILALKNISIKNIGIVHNREYEGGVLRIEFYQEEAIERSTKILREKGYSLHNKN